MGLGSVALGYGHPEVTRAASEAAQIGVVGPLPPVLEEALAADLCRLIPWIERVRFLKTGAEAMAAAVRLARVVTGRDAVLGCGYHGWLDWCETREGKGVPAATRALYARAAVQRARGRPPSSSAPPVTGSPRSPSSRSSWTRPTPSGSPCSARRPRAAARCS